MSMLSIPGEDEGTGGVVPSRSIGGVLMWSFPELVSQHDIEANGTYTFRPLEE